MASRTKPPQAELNGTGEGDPTPKTRSPRGSSRRTRVATPPLTETMGPGLLVGPDDFFLTSVAAIRATLGPVDAVESLLVDRMIQAAWRLRHVALIESRGATALDAEVLAIDVAAERSLFHSLEALERRRTQTDPDRRSVTRWRRVSPGPRANGLDGPDPRGGCPVEGVGPERGADAEGEAWRGRLVFDANVSADSPVVRGTWVTVNHIISLIVDGWSWPELLRSHPELSEDDLRACLAYHVQEETGGSPRLA